MSNDEFTPTEWEVREQYAEGNIHAEGEFDRMIAEVERAAAARALDEAASSFEATTHAWGKLAMVEHLRARAAAYRQERGEQ